MRPHSSSKPSSKPRSTPSQPRVAAGATLFALCLQALVLAPITAQALKAERRSYARVLEQRRALLEACVAAPRDRLRELTRHCATAALDVSPLSATADLVRIAVGAERDDSATLRGGTYATVVPEVVDMGAFDSIYVTLRLARPIESTARVTFVCTLRDASGDVVREAEMLDPQGVAELLRVEATTRVDVQELPDGRYEVEVIPSVDAALASPDEVPLRTPVWIHRDYKRRIDRLPLYLDPFHPESAARGAAAAAALAELAQQVDTAAERAAYAAAYFAVDRAFRGEPPLPGADPLADLDHLDRIVANAAKGREPFDGIHGRVTIGLPVELPAPTAPAPAPDARSDAPSDAAPALPVILAQPHARVSVELLPPLPDDAPHLAKPLVIVLPGTATWDGETNRPPAQRGVPPEWTLAELAAIGFGADRSFHLAVIEGLGRLESPIHALPQVTRALRKLLATGDAPILWVGEREGAFVVCRAMLVEPDLATSALLVNGGGFANSELERLSAAQIFVAPSDGHATEANLLSLVERGGERVHLVEGAERRPWPIALPLALKAIEPLFARARATVR